MISELEIRNIKGFGDPGFKIKFSPQQVISTNKINILVAPNGFGKSSISAAINQLCNSKITLNESLFHKKNEKNLPYVKMEIDNKKYSADSNKNDIINVITPFVINCPLKANAKAKNMQGVISTKGEMAVQSVELKASVPAKAVAKYHLQTIQASFGVNSKILKSYTELFKNPLFLKDCIKLTEILIKFDQVKRNALVKEIVDKINSIQGTANQIRESLQDSVFNKIKEDEFYSRFVEIMQKWSCKQNDLEYFLLFFQIRDTFKRDNKALKQASLRADFDLQLEELNNTLKMLNTSNNQITAKVRKDVLEISYPAADFLSNGQRDLLYFFSKLAEFQIKKKAGKKYLLLIDEVFDYLDDANYVAAQYYLSEFTKKYKGEIYIVLLTHLDPQYFRSTVFKEKTLNVVYLKDVHPKLTPCMEAFITLRSSLERPQEDDLYQKMSAHYMHYHPDLTDIKSDLVAKQKRHLKTEWGSGVSYYEFLISHINKYLSSSQEYDPYAVATALRIRMEKIVYEGIPASDRTFFLTDKACFTTVNKFNFAEEKGFSVNDLFYMTIPLTNDADHLDYKKGTSQLEEHPLIYKIDHPVMRNIIKEIFNYNGVDLTLDCIR